MADEPDFEPKLGRPGKDRRPRPRSQLKALAKSARWGKVRTYNRPKLAWGTVRHNGRGKGAAAIAHHHAHPRRRRLFLQTSIAVAGPSGTKAFAAHIAYIARDGTSERGGEGRIFDRSDNDASPAAFNARARGDVRQFRWLVSPDDAGEVEDLTRFTRTLMNQVERDLRREVDWVAASHFNTAHPHIHIAVRGGVPEVDELIIARRYLIHGLRHRAEEALTAELGYRRSLELAAETSRAASQDRYTFIDRDLKRAALSGEIDLSQTGPTPAKSSWACRLSRLSHLRTRGLAEHLAGPVWRLQPGWEDTLRKMGRELEHQQDVAAALGGRLDSGNLQEFPAHLPGAAVTGQLSAIAAARTPAGPHTIIVDGLDGRQWAARTSARAARALPAPGGVITLLPAPSRLEAGRAPAPDPEARAPFELARFTVDSWIPAAQQVRRLAYTWLDQLDETRLKDAAGFGADVRAARRARQLWLEAQGLYPPDRARLDARELEDAAAGEASRLGQTYVRVTGRGAFRGVHAGYLITAQGRFAVIAGDKGFALAALNDGEAPVLGQDAVLEAGKIRFGKVLSRALTRTR